MPSSKNKPLIISENIFPVVGIGASAGGLDAFKKLLTAIPVNSGMAYVLVQHLDPNHDSLLPDILQKVTPIPVLEIADDMTVKPDHIYIIPSNKILTANDGILQLEPRERKAGNVNMPIDVFFTSLAAVHQTQSIGVILSGTGSDGTKGLKAIKDQGGITLAQDEQSAAYAEMPANATRAGVIDFILTPQEMPKKLVDIKLHVNRSDGELENFPVHDEEIFRQLLSLLRVRKGTDFTFYKQTTIRRRILRRMALNKSKDITDYLAYLQENKTEQDVLYQDLLIPVTSFFRDNTSFANLSKSVFPQMIKNKIAGEPIRIWVAGCSTGEEAYSIAITIKEVLGDQHEKVQLFATDISEPAIEKARFGLYTKADVEGVSAQRLAGFFTRTNGSYHVVKPIRDMCVFAVHNFLKDPPFGKIDFISCRNVLIYLEPYLQKKVLTTFHYALNPKGILLLGKSESRSSVPDLFAPTDKNDRLFIRKDAPGRFMHLTGQYNDKTTHAGGIVPKSVPVQTDFQKTADNIILSRYSPAGVVVNEAMDIVHFRGSTGTYLESAPGKPTHQLLKMAKNGLEFELRNLLHKAKKENKPAIKEGISLEVNGGQQHVTIEVIPLPNIVEPHYLVLFHNGNRLATTIAATPKRKAAGTTKLTATELRILQLEQELSQLREDMRSVTEGQEAAIEELQSANEELQSGSEELQSLNEEMETSKEELQSTNEELLVLNQELQNLNEQVTAARDYAENIVTTVRTPLLVLDKNLRVVTANTSFYKTFHVNQYETEGKLIYDLGSRQWDIPALRKMLGEILPDRTKLNDFEVNHHFPMIGERTMLLNASEITKAEVGEKSILLAIEDITERKKNQLIERQLLGRFTNFVLHAPVAICILKGKDYTIELANDVYLKLVEKSTRLIGMPFFEALPELRPQNIKEIIDNVVQSGQLYHGDEVEIQLKADKKEKRYFNFVYQPMYDNTQLVEGVIIVMSEVTDQVIARKRMEVQELMARELLMTAPGFICTLNGPDHVYDLINKRYQQLFGKRKLQGLGILKALPELAGQGFDTILDKVYDTGEPFIGIEVPMRLARDEGVEPEIRYFNFSYQPIYKEDKQIYSILVFGYEVTEQVNAKNRNLENEQIRSHELETKVSQRTAELSEANDLLRQKNEELESFTYVSSHDLQEPLRKIQTFANLILQNESAQLSDRGKDYFQRMQDAAQRMQTLIEDLLAYSRTDISKRVLQKTDLTKLTTEVRDELAEIILEKNAVIEVLRLDEIPVNTFLFRQVINNIIANALKFSKKEQPPHIVIQSRIKTGTELQHEHRVSDLALSLNTKKLSPRQLYCHISIADNGIGFEPEYKEQVFEVFQRLHDKDEYPGTGIGLAIVKKIVENHEGIVTATGEPGKGTTIDIYVPV